MKQQILDGLLSLLHVLGECFKSFASDARINCKAPNAPVLIMSSISYKIQRLIECFRIMCKLFKTLKWNPFKRFVKTKTNSVEKDKPA